MSWFQLDPQSIANRARSAAAPIPSLGASVMRGTLGFTAVSVAGFVPWAVFGRWFNNHGGELVMYLVCAAVFIALAGPLLHRLIIGPGSLPRFYKLFGLTFTVYAAGWISGWVAMPRLTGSIAGLAFGTFLMGALLSAAFDAPKAALPVGVVLFALNCAGYFLGGLVNNVLLEHHALVAKLLWGVIYGLGFGAGLGLAFHLCQKQARAILAAR